MGFGGFLQFIAVIGFVIGVIGIALTVVAVSQGRPVRGGISLAMIGFVLGLVFMVVSSGLLEVGVTETAVVYNTLTGELGDPRGPGIHVILPWAQQVSVYPTNQQEYTMSGLESEGAREGDDAVTGRSIDGQTVTMDVTILFSIPRDQVNRIHSDWNSTTGGYREAFIRPVVRSVVRDVVSGYQAEEIYGVRRNELQTEIENQLREQLAARGFELSYALLRNITFSPEFTQAIEDKQIEEQRLQQAATAAERRETEARGAANAVIESARGDAEARLVQARAEAEGLRLVSDQLAANPNLLQYIYIQSLGDNVSLAIIPSNSPFLFDSATFTNLSPDFVAPGVPELVPTPEPTTTGN